MKIKTKLRKGKSKIILLSIIFLTMIILSYSSLAQSYQKIPLDKDKIQIQTGFNEPVLDIQLLENTDQCLGKCHAIILIHPYQTLTLPEEPTDSENLEFLNPYNNPGLRSYSFELLQETQYTITTPIYETVTSICTDNQTQPYQCQKTQQTGEKTVREIKKSWVSFPFWGHTFEAGKDYTIKIKGEKYPTLGPNNIDWLLTLKGIPLTEWAWWNSSWTYRRQITITNNNNSAILEQGYTINLTFNHSQLIQEGKSSANGNDIRIVFNHTQELDRTNTTPFNISNTTLWFPLQTNISPSSYDSTNYFLYYGNSQAGNSPANKSNIFIFSEDFESLNLGDLRGQVGWFGSPNVFIVTSTDVYEGSKSVFSNGSSQTDASITKLTFPLSQGVFSGKFKSIGDNVGSDIILKEGTKTIIDLELNADSPSTTNTVFWWINNGTTHLDIGRYPPSQWFDITIIFNKTHSKVIVNGTVLRVSIQNNNIITNNITNITLIRHAIGGQDQFDITYRDFLTIRKLLNPEPEAILGPEEPMNGSLIVQNMISIQVIENVDFVKGKRTLVRTILNYLNGTNPNIQKANITIYLNNTPVVNTINYLLDESKIYNVDLWFQPQVEGQNLSITSEVSSSVPGFVKQNMTRFVNITKTRQFNVTYVPIQGFGLGPLNMFNRIVNSSSDFLKKTYPIAEDGLKVNTTLPAQIGPTFFFQRNDVVMRTAWQTALLTNESPERAVAIVPNNYFESIGPFSATTCGSAREDFPAVIVEEGCFFTPVHEIGHTYTLCDEYNYTLSRAWELNNDGTKCPNGDKNNDSILDRECQDLNGCPTSSLEPISGKPDNQPMRNLMGVVRFDDSWITNETFSFLLKNFTHSSPEQATERVMVSGTVNRTSGEVQFLPFYTVGAGPVINTSEVFGENFTLELLDNQSNILYNLSFSVSFILYISAENETGNITEINESSFVFMVPFSENVSQFIVRENETIEDQRNVSANIPIVNSINPSGGEFFSNEVINIFWNATDMDGDNLSYSVMLSDDNGSTFDVITLDYSNTSILLNSSQLPDSRLYKIKILATDGVNTGFDLNNGTFEIDNDLNITDFSVVYTNQTQRVFKIIVNNTLNEIIENISWSLDTGNGIKNSEQLFNLNSGEEIFIFIYHNYSMSGIFNVTATVYTSNKLESESIEINI